MNYRKMTDSFLAVAQKGTTYQIHEYTEMVDATDPGQPPLEGMRSYETIEGDIVNPISNSEFVVFTGLDEVHVWRA